MIDLYSVFHFFSGLLNFTESDYSIKAFILSLYIAVILLALPIIIHGVKHSIKRRRDRALIKAYYKN